MQVVISSSFGTSYGWAWQIGMTDARGQIMQAYVSNSEDGPHSIVYFG